MLKRTIVIFLFCLLSTAVWTQELVSNIENIGNSYTGNSRGFVEYQGKEYLIEQGKVATEISLIENGEINLLHTIAYRPSDGNAYHYLREYSENNSGFFVQEDKLYEFYDFNIIIIDFVNGTVVKDVDLCAYDIKPSFGYFSIVEDKLLFDINISGKKTYYTYDLENDELEKIEWSEGKNLRVAKEWLYALSEDLNQIEAYNLKTCQVDAVHTIPNVIKTARISNNLQEPRINILTETNEIIEIIGTDIVFTSNCFVDQNVFIHNTYQRDGILYASINSSGTLKVVAMNAEICSEFMSFEHLDVSGPVQFIDNKALDPRYLMFSQLGDYFSLGKHYIIDIEQKTATNLDIPTDILASYESLVIDDVLYINGVDDVDAFGFVYKCFGVNLQDKTSFTVPVSTEIDLAEIIIGEKRGDKKIYFITYDFDNEKNLWEYETTSNTAAIKREKLDQRNLGVQYIIRTLKVGEKYYYSDEGGIYVIHGNNAKKLIEGRSNMPLVENDGIVSGLIMIDTHVFSFEINSTDDSWDMQIVEDFNQLDIYSIATRHAIFYTRVYGGGKGYFDVKTREFVLLEDRDASTSFRILAVSGDNAIIHYYSYSMGDSYYIFDTNMKEFKKLAYLSADYEDAVSDGNGGFFLIEYGQSTITEQKIVHVDADGELIDEFVSEFSFPYYEDPWTLNDDALIFPLPGNDEMQVLMSTDNETKIRTIPFENTNYYWTIFARYYKDKALIANRVDGLFQATYFSYDDDPVDLSNGGVSDDFLEAVFSDEKVAIFYKVKDENKIRIEIFDLETYARISSEEYKLTKERYPEVKALGKISKLVSLFSYDNGENGQETYSFNIETGEYKLHYDQSEGPFDSDPDDFVSLSDYSYFTALSDDRSRQWYRIQNSDLTKVEIESIENLNLYPNPTSDFISFDSKIISYEIVGANGVVYLKDAKTDMKKVNVSKLPIGFYTFLGTDDSGEKQIGKFIIQR